MDVGAHVSVAGGVDNAVERLLDVGGTCGQLFTTSPQVWAHPSIDAVEARDFREASTAADVGPWIIHATYLVNPATPNADLRARSIERLQADLDAADRLGIEYVNVHVGAHTGAGVDEGLANAATTFDSLTVPEGVTLLLETDAGGGTKLGDDFEHLQRVLETCSHSLGVCLDTAHVFAAGYDLSTGAGVDATLAELDDTVGVEALTAVHLNDSKHDCGTGTDEHAHLGEGAIGVDGLAAFLNHEAIADLPVVVETPTEDGKGFAWNIDRVRTLRQ